MTRDNVLGLEAVLADGTVITVAQPHGQEQRRLRPQAGVHRLGGTLGIVTRVVVRLGEAPVSRPTALAALPASTAVPELLRLLQRRLGGQLAAYEVMWGDYVRAVTEPAGTARR